MLNGEFINLSSQFLCFLTSWWGSCVAPERRSRSKTTFLSGGSTGCASLRSLSVRPSVRCVTSRPPVSYVLLALHLLLACRSTLRVTRRSPQKRKPPSAGPRVAGGDILKGCPRGVSRLPIGRPRRHSKEDWLVTPTATAARARLLELVSNKIVSKPIMSTESLGVSSHLQLWFPLESMSTTTVATCSLLIYGINKVLNFQQFVEMQRAIIHLPSVFKVEFLTYWSNVVFFFF